MSAQVAPPAALTLEEKYVAFVFLIGWAGGHLPVYLDGAATPARWFEITSWSVLGLELLRHCERWDARGRQIEVGLPCNERRTGVGTTTVLTVPIETPASARNCHRWLKLPTFVLRFGRSAKRIVLWGMSEPVPAISAEAANKKLAYACHSPYRMVDPDRVRIPVPGSSIRVGRKRPAPVTVTALNPDATYTRSELVGRLKDPPAPYMQRLREGLVQK